MPNYCLYAQCLAIVSGSPFIRYEELFPLSYIKSSVSYFPCHSEKEEQVAVLDTAVPTVGLGDLPITVARGSVPSGVDCG